MDKEIYYSAVEDDWSYSDDSIEEVAQMIFDDMDDVERGQAKAITIYKGVKREQHFGQFLSVNRLLEQMSESAYEECGECSEDYLEHVTDSQKKELEAVILAWASRNNISPSWFMIEDIEEVKFNIPDGW